MINIKEYKKNGFLLLIILICIFTFTNPLKTYGTELLEQESSPIFEEIGRESGLSNLSVSNIIQDKYGFMWFGTQGGLNYYNGLEMEVYKRNPFSDDKLVHNLIQTMYYDEENHEIWIGTYQGVSRFIINQDKFENYTVENSGLSNPVVISVEKDNHNDIWIGTLEGLNRLDLDTGKISVYEVPGDVVRDITIDSKNRLLIGTYEGLCYFDYKKRSIEKIDLDLPSPYIMQIEEFEKGTLTLGVWDGGTVEVDMNSLKTKVTSYDDNRVYSIYKTDDDILWTGTWGGGLFAVNSEGERYHFNSSGEDRELNHSVVYSLYQDESGILWIGTNGGGITKINKRNRNYVIHKNNPKDEDSLTSGKINKIFIDSMKNLWVSVYNEGLNRYDEASNKFIKYRKELDPPYYIPDNQVIDIIEWKPGILYFGSGDGVTEYNITENEITNLDILNKGTLVYALEKQGESRLWIGTYTEGVYLYDFETKEKVNYRHVKGDDKSISDNLIYDIIVDKKDRVWIGTNNGLNVIHPQNGEINTYHRVSGDFSKIASNTIRCLFEDSKGRIWIGMVGGGLALYDEENDSFISYTESDGLSSNTVMSIVEGENGKIWMSTQDGISILNPKNNEITKLNKEDGIGGYEFNQGGVLDNKGNILFGGIHGIVSIPMNLNKENVKSPKIYITNIDIYHESLDKNRKIFNNETLIIEPDDNYLSFNFIALDYDAGEKIKYFYKLEGFDNEWVSAGDRNYASYSNIPHGEYTFKVKAKTYRDIETEIANVSLTIKTPWHKTIYAYFGYLVLIGLLFYALVRIREGFMLNKRNKELSTLNYKLEDANKKLEKLSTRDPLTSLYNRRFLNRIINEQFNLARRSETYISFIMIDIDYFKKINDNFGHIVGDEFLIEVSSTIKSVLTRKTDFLARYGGDEFAVLLYDTNEEGALNIAKKINKSFDKVSSKKEYSDEEFKTTLSIGIVTMVPKNESKSEEMIKLADDALYTAKKKGKNQINNITIYDRHRS
ncbi:MAG: diguanylate cyclase [Eubacteriales bacterium]